jgi:hypothetical protein
MMVGRGERWAIDGESVSNANAKDWAFLSLATFPQTIGAAQVNSDCGELKMG